MLPTFFGAVLGAHYAKVQPKQVWPDFNRTASTDLTDSCNFEAGIRKMKEITDIIRAFDQAQRDGKRSALATVVLVEGSSYRRPGARMLITEDGRLTGAISGGCLEGDALRKAMFAIMSQHNKLVIYDTTDEDDLKFGVQLGCNGIVYILFEPLDAFQENNPIYLLRQLIAGRQDAVLATFFAPGQVNQPGTRLLYRGGPLEGKPPENIKADIEADMQQAFQQQVSGFTDYTSDKDRVRAFIEFISPPIALVIAGAGNDAQPLVEMASLLGWRITVADGRSGYATAQRFPKADQLLPAKPASLLAQLQPDRQTVFLLMTHNYNYDLALLKELIRIDYAYIGMLGPAQKRDRMFRDLEKQGIFPDENQKSRIFGPVGLDIGAETAAEIALSVLAEIKASFSGRKGLSLKLKQDAIHPRHADSINHV
jgi:xanthine/CO dehydrogenase XdhC/CoxF family maturation factor